MGGEQEIAQPSGQTKAWTTGELKELREHACLGAREAARLLGRSVGSVKWAAFSNRISLRRPGSRRGSVLGQPRGVSLRANIRANLVSGVVDAELIARRILADHDAELCPWCAVRPVRVVATGLCGVCHRSALIEKHNEAIAELTALREHNRVKQQAKRLRDVLGAECST